MSKGFPAPLSGLVMGSGLSEAWKGPSEPKIGPTMEFSSLRRPCHLSFWTLPAAFCPAVPSGGHWEPRPPHGAFSAA